MNPIDMGVAVEWFEVTGRGRVANFVGGDHDDPRSLLGKVVTIDNADYLVTGVEHFAIVCPRPNSPFGGREKCTHPFGLLVQSWPEEA